MTRPVAYRPALMALRDKMGAGFGGGSVVAAAARRTSAHYDTVVNKGKLNMATFASTLNVRWGDGWALHSVFEQDGNTVVVFERRDDI